MIHKNPIRKYYTFILTLITFYSSPSFATSIDDAIDLGIRNSLEVKIEARKTEFTGLSKFEAATDFLPNVSYNYRDGKRNTEINNLKDKQDDKVKTLTLSENLFNGFSGVSKFTASVYQSKSADQALNLKKNEIALQVSEAYLNILKYRQIIAIDDILAKDYQKLVGLASKRLSLKDISYSEFADYALRANKVKVEANQNKIALSQYETNFIRLTGEKPSDLSSPNINQELARQYDDLMAIAIDRNPKIKSAFLTHQAKKAMVVAESGKLLPTISMHLQYENEKSSYYFNGQELKNRSAYINFSVPIFQNGIEYTNIAKANKERQIADLEKQLAVKEIEKGVRDEYQKYSSLRENLSTSKEALEMASKSLNLAKRRFDQKDIGLMDYLLQKINTAEAEKQLLTVECDYAISHYNLKFLINEITATAN